MKTKLDMYTVYSDSHKTLYSDYFLPTASEWYTVISECQEQKGSGSFNDKKFGQSTRKKIETILSGFSKSSEKDWFVFSDCDIMFFRDFEDDMSRRIQNVDFVAQSDCGGICTGFMAIKKNSVNESFFKMVLDYMDENLYRSESGEGFHDQQALNEVIGVIRRGEPYKPQIQRPNFSLVKYFDGYGNLDHVMPGVQWNEQIDIPLKFVPYMWHANFTVGMDNKIKMLKQVQNKVNLLRRKNFVNV